MNNMSNLSYIVRYNDFAKLKELTTRLRTMKVDYMIWYKSVGIEGLTQEQWSEKFGALSDEDKKTLLEKDIFFKHNMSFLEKNIVEASIELCKL